jgi:hypothetical protein
LELAFAETTERNAKYKFVLLQKKRGSGREKEAVREKRRQCGR